MVPPALSADFLRFVAVVREGDSASKKPLFALVSLPVIIAIVAAITSCCVCCLRRQRVRREEAKKIVPSPLPGEGVRAGAGAIQNGDLGSDQRSFDSHGGEIRPADPVAAPGPSFV